MTNEVPDAFGKPGAGFGGVAFDEVAGAEVPTVPFLSMW